MMKMNSNITYNDVILLRNTFCLQRGNVKSFRGYLRHPVVLPEGDRFAHAE